MTQDSDVAVNAIMEKAVELTNFLRGERMRLVGKFPSAKKSFDEKFPQVAKKIEESLANIKKIDSKIGLNHPLGVRKAFCKLLLEFAYCYFNSERIALMRAQSEHDIYFLGNSGVNVTNLARVMTHRKTVLDVQSDGVDGTRRASAPFSADSMKEARTAAHRMSYQLQEEDSALDEYCTEIKRLGTEISRLTASLAEASHKKQESDSSFEKQLSKRSRPNP